MPEAREMPNEVQVSIRLPRELVARADTIASTMSKLAEYEMIGVTKATVLRLAIVRGLQVLEGQYSKTKSEPKK